VDTVVALAPRHSLFLCDLGYFQVAAFAKMAAAYASFLSRFHQQTTLREVVGGRTPPLDLPQCLGHESRTLLEKAVRLGTRDPVAARLLAVRMPEAIVNERRRQAYVVAKKRGYTPSQAHLSLLAWNLFITNVPAAVWPSKTVGIVYALRWQVELVFKAWKSDLHLATLPTKTEAPTLCYLYGRLLLIILVYALCPALRTALWTRQQRGLSVLKLVRYLQAFADRWLQALFESTAVLGHLLSHICISAQRVIVKASRKRRTSAQRLRKSIETQNDGIEFTIKLAA
jgi:hypothetical protein